MEESVDIEDGEIIDSYTPLQRPEISIQMEPNEQNEQLLYSDNDNENDSDDDSDQDSDSQCFRPKKLKVKSEKSKPILNQKGNKYNVWSIGLQEEALTATLKKCDVESVDRSRDVESYNYKCKFFHDDRETAGISDQLDEIVVKTEIKTKPPQLNNKRRYEERRNGKPRLSRHLSPHNQWRKPRTLTALEVPPQASLEEVAADIAMKLYETKDYLIKRTVEILGNEKAIQLFNETKRIEADGGMLVMNGSRRRTSGGVFLTLVKSDDKISHDMLKEIFGPEKTVHNKFKRHAVALKRKKKTNQLRKSLIEDGLLTNDFPVILEQKVRDLPLRRELIKIEPVEIKSEPDDIKSEPEETKSEPDDGDGDHAVSNPPPSPATDQDTPPPNIRQITSYDGDEDFLDIGGTEDMELF